jgi:hypothetical protein
MAKEKSSSLLGHVVSKEAEEGRGLGQASHALGDDKDEQKFLDEQTDFDDTPALVIPPPAPTDRNLTRESLAAMVGEERAREMIP